ncbi:LOW QUALITY PROTEIN: protocadherin alpha-12-like [Erethizon dorsatum]
MPDDTLFIWGGGQEYRLHSILLAVRVAGSDQLHYWVPEEAEHGNFVGRIAQDLALELAELVPRLFQVASKHHGNLLEVNLQNGIFVNSWMNREELRQWSAECSIHVEVIVERPLRVFHVEVEVKDLNHNPPVYRQTEQNAVISESESLGKNFPLEGASGADIGINLAYVTTIIQLNASELDEGLKREISYGIRIVLSVSEKCMFSINLDASEMRIYVELNFEENNAYEIQVNTIDKGNPSMLLVLENARVGIVNVLIIESDRDRGVNGQVTCSLTLHVPIKLVFSFKNHYSLVLDSALNCESVPDYEVVVTARDGGSPPLWALATVSVEVANVNDNAPVFAQPEYTVFVKENNPPGFHIFTVARDADAQENALVSYSLVERRVGGRLLSSYVSVHAESSEVFALQPLDHEELELLQFQVSARDSGVPALGSNVTLHVFVIDNNDHASVLAVGTDSAGHMLSELMSQPVGAGHEVVKVHVVDADSGYNACLSYELLLISGSVRSRFCVGLYTGEIGMTKAVDKVDAPHQRLVVPVRDRREPALMATDTLVSLVEISQVPNDSSLVSISALNRQMTLVDVNMYLFIVICVVYSLLVLTLLLYTVLQCSAAHKGVTGPVK